MLKQTSKTSSIDCRPEKDVLDDVIAFFGNILEAKENQSGYRYAVYSKEWLEQIGLTENSADESKTAKTTKELQRFLVDKYVGRVKAEARVAEGMMLRFDHVKLQRNESVDASKLQAFDLLDEINGVAIEISLSDAFAEFFKDVLKALLDSRVKKLYFCMRNHRYKGDKKSGYVKVADSPMVQQYILLARLYKLEIVLVDLYPECNDFPR